MDEKIVNFIDFNTHAVGKIKTLGDLRIMGKMEGQASIGGCINVAKSGHLKGEVMTRTALLEGLVQGIVEAQEKVMIAESSVVESSVIAPRLVVESGAKLQCYFIITPDAEERERLKKNLNFKPASLTLQSVTFSVSLPEARQVKLVGIFNDWDESKAIPFRPAKGGTWNAKIQLSPGTYEYLLIVDGQPQPDPTNPQMVPNAFGGENSVLTVPSAR